MSINEIYANIEDKWYSFLDSLDEKGIPVYKIVDPIENTGIPSLPLFAGLIVLLILGAIYAGMGGGISGTVTLSVNAMDMVSGNTLESASISVLDENMNPISTARTNEMGKATLKIPGKYVGKDLIVTLSKDNCQSVQKSITLSGSEITVSLNTQCSEQVTPESCLGISGNLTTIQLTDSKGAIPAGCTVQIQNPTDPTDIISVDWMVDGSGYLHISEPDVCPSEGNYDVIIDCKNMKYEASWNEFLSGVKIGVITMQDKEEPKVVINSTNVVSVPIKVESSDGTPLEGIIVTATDENGVALEGTGEVVTSGKTDATGTVVLKLPRGQQFYLTANDPNGAYFSQNISGNGNFPYTVDSWTIFSGITLTMYRGFKTTIYVKEQNTQKPISGALVSIWYNGKLVAPETPTDTTGKVVFVLLKEKTYDVEVRSAAYGIAKQTVTGGGNITIWMSEIDLAKVGDLEVHVVSAHGMKDPMTGVVVELVKGNQTYGRLTTNDAGLVKFTNIEEGAYSIKAKPPGSVYYQSFPTVTVTAGNTTVTTIEVVPKQAHITVKPLICIHANKCVPKENVHVEIWNRWLEEKINETETGTTRKAEFTVDYGTTYSLVASWVDPDTKKKYGPVTYVPGSPAYSDTTIELEVRETSNANVSFTINGLEEGTLVRGKVYTGILRVTLPEFAPGQKFKEVDIEVFTGDTGSIASISRTPIAIGDVSLTDLTTQDPLVVSVKKADEYYYGKEPKENDVGLSKYMKIIIGKYAEAKEYTAEIPIYVRLGAHGPAKINYRATWVTPDGRKIQSNDGLWKTVSYEIGGNTQTGSIPLTEGTFYAYNAWLSSTKEGSKSSSVTITNGSYVYVNFDATVREDTDNWIININSVPQKLRPISFEGWIERHNSGNRTYITQMQMNGWTIQNTQGLYSLKRDDVLHGIITLQAMAPGDASVVLFKDVDHPLNVHISEIPPLEKDTSIAGVTGELSAVWQAIGNSDLTGTINVEKDVLPTDNKIFNINIVLKNSEKKQISAKVVLKALDDSIKFTDCYVNRAHLDGTNTYIQILNVTIPAGGETPITVAGIGRSDSLNEMGIFVYEAGTPAPTKPWAIIHYGPVDFKMVYRCMLDTQQLSFPTESCNEVDVKIIKSVAGHDISLTKGVTVNINGKIATLTNDYFSAKFQSGIGKRLDIEATSDYFGLLKETPDVAYLNVIPQYPNSLDFTKPRLPILNEERTKNITITNNYPIPVTFKVGNIYAKGWDIVMQPDVYYMNGTNYTKVKSGEVNKEITVLPGQDLVINIKVKPTDIVCREKQNPVISIQSKEALPEPLSYGVILQCNSTGAISAHGFKVKPKHVTREPTPPEAITKFSCSYIPQFNTSYLCDAEQLAIAIGKAADDLLKDPEVYSATYTYAFGNDELTQAAFEEAIRKSGARFDKVANVFETEKAAKQSAGHDLVFNADVTCGYVTVNLTKFNMDQDIKVSVSVNTGNATWCNRDKDNAYLIGLMNFDRDIRPMFGDYFSFTSDTSNADIFKAIETARSAGNNVTASSLFGYGVDGVDPDTIVSTITGGNAQSFVKWKVCPLDNSLDCPGFAVNYLKTHPELGVIGYMRINEYNDVFLGLVYRKEKVPEQMLPRYEAAMITRLMGWAMLGEKPKEGSLPMGSNAFWVYAPEKDDLTNVIDIVGPNVTSVRVYWVDNLGAVHTDFAGSLNVTVRITVDKSAKFCYVANVMPDGRFVGPKGKGEPVETDNIIANTSKDETFEYVNWTLIPGVGTKRVAAYCVDEAGVTSKVKVGTIKLDVSGIELVGKLPSAVLMFQPFEENRINFKVMSRYTDVTRCWLEWPKDTIFNGKAPQPTDGALGNCTTDKNHNNYVGDGCCNVESYSPGQGLTYYNYFNVTCNTVVIPDGQYNKYIPVKVKCENAAGEIKTLGEVNMYEYAPNAPVILLPGTPFAMGWYNNGSQTPIVLDQPLINGESWEMGSL